MFSVVLYLTYHATPLHQYELQKPHISGTSKSIAQYDSWHNIIQTTTCHHTTAAEIIIKRS